ncbi:hypothetical protein N7499_004688 [Penicillium canescens]|uniref:Uncharacterized protein n=1 Tax=Penicillium canescens TaxID=5083 RepID=A0AAD6I1P4_PENCN|nr:uncharacterized protein N7446_004815 [Penicillium canescens]KAJ6009911.1 hypothetical protein N7522_004927 [Penicillium canescens]KAJ6026584.1 hypothetical protein N7460_011401 [Penicillium canescens]KAJ6039868.1 hypothetical protein N7444_008773 [Penicillium canescens]KAJ6067778.1 hypothetical protein N7446_004815 [Penicillium canescens]KAJ6085059.1 hypothetical protein N7499_004688 [Penicillium canescens]
MSTSNYSIPSIIAAYGLGIAPHGYYLVKMMANARGQSSNILPRENLSTLKGQISAQVWDKLARARGAHLNAMEGLPMFAAAMLAGNLANLPAKDMNTLAVEYLGARILYTALYMGVRSEAASYLRTGVWAWSISLPIWALYKAGKALNAAE